MMGNVTPNQALTPQERRMVGRLDKDVGISVQRTLLAYMAICFWHFVRHATAFAVTAHTPA